MCGTAAEVTPIREVDDVEIGVGRDHAGDPEGVPRHGERPSSDRWAQWRDPVENFARAEA